MKEETGEDNQRQSSEISEGEPNLRKGTSFARTWLTKAGSSCCFLSQVESLKNIFPGAMPLMRTPILPKGREAPRIYELSAALEAEYVRGAPGIHSIPQIELMETITHRSF